MTDDSDNDDANRIFSWLRAQIRARSAYTESDSEYDGAFSYAAEWHSFTHGVYKGLTTPVVRHPPQPDIADVRKESHYYRGGYVLGTLLRALLTPFRLLRR